MNILLRQARIIDQASSHHGKTMDILVENGIITTIRAKIATEKNVKVIESSALHVSAGWLDMQANFCDPGYEHKEDLASGLRAAAAGGFTGVAVISGTNPPLHSKAEIMYLKNKAEGEIVDVYPVGTVSHRQEGKDISEMYDMKLAGAVAFSDDKKSSADAGLLLRALLYSRNFDGLIITHCDEKSVSQDGMMNEGLMSTMLGLKGRPALAEELSVSRSIQLAEYAGAPLHIANISTQGAVALVRQAKEKGLKISASVNAYNLVLDDSLLKGFDSNYKVNPPLRTKQDIEALKKGLADGSIDCITTDHRPQDIESKAVEFDHAANGMIGLETAFALLNTNRGKMRIEQLISALTTNPRKVLKLEQAVIEEGNSANLTFFDPEETWTFTKKHIRSKSSNTPFIGETFKGRVIGIMNRKQLSLNRN